MELPDTHLAALTALSRRPPDSEAIDADALADLRKWGMVMPHSLELTGMGARYAGLGERGVCLSSGSVSCLPPLVVSTAQSSSTRNTLTVLD